MRMPRSAKADSEISNACSIAVRTPYIYIYIHTYILRGIWIEAVAVPKRQAVSVLKKVCSSVKLAFF